MLQDFRSASKALGTDNMTVTIKGILKDGSDTLENGKLPELQNQIENAINQHSIDAAATAFNNDKGPNNATKYIWPRFEGILYLVIEIRPYSRTF